MSQRHREGGARGRPALPVALTAVLTALGLGLAACGVAGQVPDPPVPAASVPSPTAASPTAPAATAPAAAEGVSSPDEVSPAASTATQPTSSAAAPEDATSSGPAPSVPASASPSPGLVASAPVEVRLPTIDVVSVLHPLGLAADGTLEVPTGPLYDQAAWYSGSPTPGEIGPTVIEGHVTSSGGRPSVFFELGAVATGDRVEVDREDGRTVVYEVYRVDRFAKDAFPTVDVYGSTPGPELRVITCGGEFDEGSEHHVDNTVLFARQVSIGG